MPRTKKAKGFDLGWFIKPVAVVVLVFGLFSIIWMRTRVMEVRYQIGEIREIQKRLLDEQKDLIAARNQFASPARIATNAGSLGLSVPDRGNVYVVRYDTRIVQVSDRGTSSGAFPRL